MGGLWGSRLSAQFGNLAIHISLSASSCRLFEANAIQYEAWRWIHRLVYLAYIFRTLSRLHDDG